MKIDKWGLASMVSRCLGSLVVMAATALCCWPVLAADVVPFGFAQGKPSNTVARVEVDQTGQRLLVNGQPFFPFGFYGGPVDALDMLREAGFNTVIRWTKTPEKSKIYLDAAQKAGLWVICQVTGYAPVRLRYADPEFRPRLKAALAQEIPAAIDQLKSHPALLGWYSLDEPAYAYALLKGEDKSIWKECQATYRTIHDHDPAHPVLTVFAYHIPPEAPLAEITDLAGIDPYWDAAQGRSPAFVADRMGSAQKIAQGAGRLPYAVLVAETYSASTRPLTPAEQRCQTYCALINGAKGITYFLFPTTYAPLWAEMKRLAAEVKILAPALLDPKAEVPVTVEMPANAKDSLQVMGRQHEGSLFILVANPTQDRLRVEFRLSGLKGRHRASVLGERKVVSVKNGVFDDTFERYGARTYRVKLPKGVGGISIAAKATVVPSPKPPTPKAQPAAVGPNLLPNSSFEIESMILPGVPEGWWKPYGFAGWKMPLIGEKGSAWGPDASTAWHGKRSLRMYRMPDQAADQYRVVAQYMPRLSAEPGKTYTLSVYAKSDKPGVRLRLFIIDAGWRNTQWVDVKVDPEWKRYSLTRKWPEGLSGGVWVRADLISPGTLWIDAMQFEEGEKTSPYKPREAQ